MTCLSNLSEEARVKAGAKNRMGAEVESQDGMSFKAKKVLPELDPLGGLGLLQAHLPHGQQKQSSDKRNNEDWNLWEPSQ